MTQTQFAYLVLSDSAAIAGAAAELSLNGITNARENVFTFWSESTPEQVNAHLLKVGGEFGFVKVEGRGWYAHADGRIAAAFGDI